MGKQRSGKKSRLYVGVDYDGVRHVFRASSTPTETSHGHIYRYSIGPFRTMRAAVIMRDYGYNNPHLLDVEDAERAAKSRHLFEGVC